MTAELVFAASREFPEAPALREELLLAYHIFAKRDTETTQLKLEKDLEVLYKILLRKEKYIFGDGAIFDHFVGFR